MQHGPRGPIGPGIAPGFLRGLPPAEGHAREKAIRSVFVANISFETTEEQLREVLSEVGPIVSLKLIYNPGTGRPRGFGFCEYEDGETAMSAVRNLQGKEVNGRPLRIDSATNAPGGEFRGSGPPPTSNKGPIEPPLHGPPVPPGAAPEAITKAVASLPPEQMFELMKQMKWCIRHNPEETRQLLLHNPQLAYGLLQAQVVMRCVDLEKAHDLLHRAPRGPPLQQMMDSEPPPPPHPLHPHPPHPPHPHGLPPPPQHHHHHHSSPPRPSGSPGDPFGPPRDQFGPPQRREERFGPPPGQRGPPPGHLPPGGGRYGGPPGHGPPRGPPEPDHRGPPEQIRRGPPEPIRRGPPGPGPPRVMVESDRRGPHGPSHLPSRPSPASSSPTPSSSKGSGLTPEDQEKAALIMQVLSLSDEQIQMLPPEQRNSILKLKEQIARSN